MSFTTGAPGAGGLVEDEQEVPLMHPWGLADKESIPCPLHACVCGFVAMVPYSISVTKERLGVVWKGSLEGQGQPILLCRSNLKASALLHRAWEQ